jgi:hypothetical protein
MITFTIFQHEKQIVGFESAGHAGYDEVGRDIVCAAVSILVQNTIECIDSFTNDSFEAKTDKEEALISFRLNTDTPCVETDTLLRALKKGILSLAMSEYSEYIDLYFKEV